MSGRGIQPVSPRRNKGGGEGTGDRYRGGPVGLPAIALEHRDGDRDRRDAGGAQQRKPGLNRAASAHHVVHQQHPAPAQSRQHARIEPHTPPGLRRGDRGDRRRQRLLVPELFRKSGGDPVRVAERAGDPVGDDVAERRQTEHHVDVEPRGALRHPVGQAVDHGKRRLVGDEAGDGAFAEVAQGQGEPAAVRHRRRVGTDQFGRLGRGRGKLLPEIRVRNVHGPESWHSCCTVSPLRSRAGPFSDEKDRIVSIRFRKPAEAICPAARQPHIPSGFLAKQSNSRSARDWRCRPQTRRALDPSTKGVTRRSVARERRGRQDRKRQRGCRGGRRHPESAAEGASPLKSRRGCRGSDLQT